MSLNPEGYSKDLHPEARLGVELYNQGEFFEAHEHLELAWMATETPERDLYQGMLQVGVAYFQIRRGNYRGALKMFQRSQRNLRHLPDSLLGIDVSQLRVDARRAENALRALGPAQMDAFDPALFRSIPPARLSTG